MGGKHGASGSVSSAVAPQMSTSHVKRRSGGRHSTSKRLSGGDSSSLVGLGLEEEDRPISRPLSASASTSRRSSRTNSLSGNSSPSSGGDEEWSSVSTQHEAARGDSTSLPSSSRNTTPSRAERPLSSVTRNDTSWQPFPQRWTPEKPKLPALYTEDTVLMNGLFDHDVHAASPFRLHPASPAMYRSPSSSSSFYRSESLPMISSTSQSSSSLYESSLSPSISFNSLSPSRASLDPRRISDTTLSIAPSPPMPSSSFQPHHLSSPNSLTNRTSPKSGPHRREGSISSSACITSNSSTSSFFPSTRRRPSTDLSRDLSDAPRLSRTSVPAFKQDQTRQARWKNFSWKTRKRSPSDEGDLVTGRAGLSFEASRLALTVATACLGPFSPLVFAGHTRIPTRPLSKSTASQPRAVPKSSYKRWQSRALRTALGLYMFYSLYLFTSRLLALPLSILTPAHQSNHKTSHLNARSDTFEYTSWQQARFKLLDVYNVAADAIGSTALRIGKQTSKAVAGDFAGESGGANSLNNLMLLDRLPEVKRRWGETSKSTSSSVVRNGSSSYTNAYAFVRSSARSCSESFIVLSYQIPLFKDVLQDRLV